MSLYVVKFGGSSLSTISRIRHAAKIVLDLKKNGHDVVVVTSAMQGVTNQLIEYVKSFSTSQNREYDFVTSSGEIVSAGLLALALQEEGIKSQALSSWQVPILVNGNYGDAQIKEVKVEKLLSLIKQDIIPVVTGFQGLSDSNEILTLGRGGSDATACALASYLQAEECLIYTDVIGVFTADPRIVPTAILIKEISFNNMMLLSKYGAKIMQYQSILIAKKYNIKIRILSSFSDNDQYTLINSNVRNINNIIGLTYYNAGMNIAIVSNAAININESTEILRVNNIKSEPIIKNKKVSILKINNEQLAISLNILHKLFFGK